MATIYVVSHKNIDWGLPAGLIPLYVGSHADSFEGLNDRSGDSIWRKNDTFCELTAQYWVWKNHLPRLDKNDIVGFCHYRRYFTKHHKEQHACNISQEMYSAQNICRSIRPHEVLLAKKMYFRRDRTHRRILPASLDTWLHPEKYRSLHEHYAESHPLQDLESSISLLPASEKYEFEKFMRSYNISPFNMYCTSVENLNSFFPALFEWLFSIESALSLDGRNEYQRRVFGFLAERYSSYYFRRHLKPKYSRVSTVSIE